MESYFNRQSARIGIPLALLASIALHILLPAESDKGWLLHVARMCLEGHRLYVGIVEINPPLIVWIYEIPVWLSMHMPWFQDFEILGLIGVIVSLFTVGVCARIIRYHPTFAGDAKEQKYFAWLMALIFIFYTTQTYFFDREHIFVVLIFPYMLRFMPSLTEQKLSWPLRLTIGILAAVGFCIKPHTIIVFVLLQVAFIYRYRSLAILWCLENCVIAGGALLYALAIMHFTPEYIFIARMALETYSEFGQKNSNYIFLPPVFFSLSLIFADFRAWYVTPYRRDVYYLVWLCVAFLAYALTNNGWGYTYNPLYCALFLVTGWMMWEYIWLKEDHEKRGLSSRRFLFGLRGCFIVFALQAMYMLAYIVILLFTIPSVRTPCEGKADCWKNGPYAQYINSHNIKSFGTISLDFTNWVALLHTTHAQWTTRFNHVWMLPKMIRLGKEYTDEHHWILEFVARAYAEDLNTNKPELILVDSSPGFITGKAHVDMRAFLSTIPEFNEAWSHYRYDETLGVCPKLAKGVLPSECQYDAFIRVP